MKSYEEKLSMAILKSGALRFGEYELSSGRISPYLLNTAMINDGESFALESSAFGDKLTEIGNDKYDVLFGPTYKAIPISVGTAIQLQKEHGVSKRFAYNRKTPKEYGDPLDRLINEKLKTRDRIMIVDDVITTGKTKKNDIALLNSLNLDLEVVGILIGMDRKEVDENGNDPIKIFQEEIKVPVHHILDSPTMFELMHKKIFEGQLWIDESKYNAFQEYHAKYGVR